MARPLVGWRPARVGGTQARDLADEAQRRPTMGTGHGSGHGLHYFVALTFAFGCIVIHTPVGAIDGAESLARALQRAYAASVGEDAEVADAVHCIPSGRTWRRKRRMNSLAETVMVP